MPPLLPNMHEPLQLQRHNEERKTTMAGLRATDNDLAVPLCLLHDLVGVAAFLASHPLHAAYLLFFARHLAALAAFFCPLLVSTTLLLSVLATVGPYLAGGSTEWHCSWSLGRTCGIAVATLCAELRPDDAGGAGLVAQLCSFVLGPGDAAAVQRVGKIVGELCDITGSCFVSEEEEEEKRLVLLGGDEEECKELLPSVLQFMDHEESDKGKDEIDEKVVISEDLKGLTSKYLGEECCQSEARFVVQAGREKAEEVVITQDQGLILSETDDTIMEKRLECDPVSVEMRECQAMEMELEVKNREPVQGMQVKTRELVRPRSSIAQRIKLWEAQASGNFKTVITEEEEEEEEYISSVKFSLGNPCAQTCKTVEGQEFKDVKECVTETLSAMHSPDLQAEANVLSEECKADEQDLHNQEEEEEEGYKDVTESQLKPATSIVGRVHSRTTSENLISDSEGSSKEWKRTLACKLYEERMQLRLCRDRAVVEGSDNMDMLWEAYEVGASGVVKQQGGIKVKREELVDQGESEIDDDGDEGSVRQLCCLQALKFSTKKMSFGGGKPSLAKMSKVLKRMAVLSRMGSRRSHKDC